jgi:hypothetical protein
VKISLPPPSACCRPDTALLTFSACCPDTVLLTFLRILTKMRTECLLEDLACEFFGDAFDQHGFFTGWT